MTLVLAVCVAGPAQAHHAFVAEYDPDLDGTLAPGCDPRGYYRDLREQGVLETLWENR